ncbi:MAG: chromosomal replication initiator protein DnaA [Pseudomonadota bacterium]
MTAGRGRRTKRESEAELTRIWSEVLSEMRVELGAETVDQWLRSAVLSKIDGDLAVITGPTRFLVDWIEKNYRRNLLRALTRADNRIRRLTFETPEATQSVDRPASAVPAMTAVPAPQEALPSAPLDPRYTFDRFIVGKPNELANAAARRVAETADASFNPVVLYGGVGLGKTHLMHAIAWHLLRTSPERKVLYLSAEQFMYRFVQALRFRDTITFKEQFRSVDVLLVDDVQYIAGKNSTQEEFFHTFNALIDQNKQIVISSDNSPDRIEGLEERIKSRLQWGLVVDIHPTDYELRLGILQSKAEAVMAEHPEVELDPKVLEFLAHRIASNVRVLEGALTRLFAFASLVGRRIDFEMTQESLSDLLRSSDKKVTLDEIKRRVGEHYNLRQADLISARRARAVARPRQVAMYLAKTMTTKSLPEIGRGFGNRDHTTVLHAVRRIESLKETDSQIAEDLELLRRMLES